MTRQDAYKKIIAYLKNDKEHYTIEKVVEDSYDEGDIQCSQIYLEPMNPTIIGWLREDLNQMFPLDGEDVVVTIENNREYTSLYARIINIYDADVYYIDDDGDEGALREGDAGAGAVCTSGAGGASSVAAMAPEHMTACVVTGMNPPKKKNKKDEKLSETRKRLEERKRLNERLAEAVKEDKVDDYLKNLKKRELPKRVLYNGSEDYEKLRKSWLEGKDAKKRYEKTLPLIDDGNPSHNPIGAVNMDDRYTDGQVDQFLSWYESHEKKVDPVKTVGDYGRPRRKRDSVEARRAGRLQERRIDKTRVEPLNLGRVEKYVRGFPGIKNYDMNSRYLDVEFEDRRIEVNFYNGLTQYCYEISMVNIVDQNGYKFKWQGASTEEFEIDFENAVNLDIELELKDNLKERRIWSKSSHGNILQRVQQWIEKAADNNVTVGYHESVNGWRLEATFPKNPFAIHIYNLLGTIDNNYNINIIDKSSGEDEVKFEGSKSDLGEMKNDVDEAVEYCLKGGSLKERRIYVRGGQGNIVQKVMRWIKEKAKDNVTVECRESSSGRMIEAKFPDNKYIMYIHNLDAMDNSDYRIKILDVNTHDDEARYEGSIDDLSELKQDVEDAVRYCIEP